MEGQKEKQSNKVENLITIFIVLIAIGIIIGVALSTKSGKMYYLFGYKPVTVLTGSMEPYMETGAVVIVKRTKEIKEQDAIFFITDDNVPVIHRFVGIDEAGKIITKGDANPKEDETHIDRAQIQGKVVFRMNWLAPFFQMW